MGNILPQHKKVGLIGRTRKRVSVFVAVLALVFQVSIQTASGMMVADASSQPGGEDLYPTFKILCSVHGAMDPRDLGLTPADFGYDDWPAPTDQSAPVKLSCPICQGHTLSQTVLPVPIFALPLPSGAAQVMEFLGGDDQPVSRRVRSLTARGPPAAV